jgi:hypothetical protein
MQEALHEKIPANSCRNNATVFAQTANGGSLPIRMHIKATYAPVDPHCRACCSSLLLHAVGAVSDDGAYAAFQCNAPLQHGKRYTKSSQTARTHRCLLLELSVCWLAAFRLMDCY